MCYRECYLITKVAHKDVILNLKRVTTHSYFGDGQMLNQAFLNLIKNLLNL